jgi:hypothetical protein
MNKDDLERLNRRTKHDWRTILSMPEGRRVIWDILLLCGTGSPFAPDNQNLTLYLLGQRDAGAAIQKKINKYGRGALWKMEDEYNSDETKKAPREADEDGAI